MNRAQQETKISPTEGDDMKAECISSEDHGLDPCEAIQDEMGLPQITGTLKKRRSSECVEEL